MSFITPAVGNNNINNMDACAAQMASWQPFSGGGVTTAVAVVGVAADDEDNAAAGGYGFPEVAHHNVASCNNLAFSMLGLSDGGHQLSGRSISCPSLNASSGGENVVLLQPYRDVMSARSHFSSSAAPRVVSWEEPSASLAKCPSLPAVHELASRCDALSNTSSMCTIASSRQGGGGGSLMHEGKKRVGRWSKRKKQMSYAFLRSLWRWKEGVHARKRRKRAVVRSCSGSGARSYTSDPPVAVGAAFNGGNVNTRSVIGTDSSGELFFGVLGNQTSWGADFVASANSSESGFCTNTHISEVQRDVGAENLLPCWLSTQSDCGHSTESGYNSEPGYSADSELNCTDDGFLDEEDDEEKQPMHLVVWKKDTAGRRPLHALDKGHIVEECVVELFYGKGHRRLQPRLRQTRRPWRKSDLYKSRYCEP